MSAVNHPPHTAHPATRAEEKERVVRSAMRHIAILDGQVRSTYRASLVLGHNVNLTYPIFGEKDIGGFDIPVNDTLSMGVGQTTGDLGSDLDRTLVRDRAFRSDVSI